MTVLKRQITTEMTDAGVSALEDLAESPGFEWIMGQSATTLRKIAICAFIAMEGADWETKQILAVVKKMFADQLAENELIRRVIAEEATVQISDGAQK